MEQLNHFFVTFVATISDVLPIATTLFLFQFLVLRRPVANLQRIIFGFCYVIFGLSLFMMGLDLALFPLGEMMAEQLTAPGFLAEWNVGSTDIDWLDYYWIYLFAFCIGFSTTIAEPSLIAVAIKANQVSGGTIGVTGLRVSVAFGVAVGISLGCYRIVAGDPLHYYIITGYIIVVIQTLYAPKLIIPLAYDSGGVTTSTVTVPIVAALGLGLATTVPGRSPLMDGFGLIAFASLFPMISVMGYAQIVEWLNRTSSVSENDNAL